MPTITHRARVSRALAVAFAGAALLVGTAIVHTQDAAPVVKTRQGAATGLVTGNVEQFLGLPYAAPPTGDLRWRAPQPPKPYAGGTLQATEFPAPCIQGNARAGLPAPSEDCLFLNLYRPAGGREGMKMPVLVYIHSSG